MDHNEETELAQLSDLADIEIGRREKRPMCRSCSRPVGVCWCKSLNGAKVPTRCRVIILQHPHEEKRCLRTSPILESLMPPENYLEFKGKKFNPSRFPKLKEILHSKNSIILYPGDRAVDLDTLPPVGESQPPYDILIPDGTWQQAKAIYHRNPYLRDLKQVRLSGHHTSQYVIRTQPTDDARSTVEAAAIVLSTLERNWAIYSLLVDPLKLICEYQINHGAVKHDSKEFLITSGRYKKPLGKRTYKKLKKCKTKNQESPTVESHSEMAENGVVEPLVHPGCGEQGLLAGRVSSSVENGFEEQSLFEGSRVSSGVENGFEEQGLFEGSRVSSSVGNGFEEQSLFEGSRVSSSVENGYGEQGLFEKNRVPSNLTNGVEMRNSLISDHSQCEINGKEDLVPATDLSQDLSQNLSRYLSLDSPRELSSDSSSDLSTDSDISKSNRLKDLLMTKNVNLDR